jgi:hypothetical protein
MTYADEATRFTRILELRHLRPERAYPGDKLLPRRRRCGQSDRPAL